MALGASGDRYEFIISAQDAYTKEITKAKAGLTGLSAHVEKAGASFQAAAAQAAKYAAVLGGAALFGGNKLIGMASDAEETANKVAVVFGQSAELVKRLSEDAAASAGASSQQFQAMSAEIGNLLIPMGFAEEAAAKTSTQMVQLAADLGSFNNIGTAEALDKIRAGLVGETEPLRSLGVQLSQVRIEEEARRMGLIKGKEQLDANSKAQATLNLILRDTAKAQGDFARTSDSYANSVKIAKAEIGNLAASIGTALLPAGKDFITIIREGTKWVKSHETEIRKAATAIGNVLVAAVRGAITVLGTIVSYGKSAVEMWQKMPGPLKAVVIGLTGVTVAVGLLTKALLLFKANPIILGLAAITTAAIFLYRNWDRIWKGITDIVGKAWNFIKKGISLIIEGLNKLGSGIEQVHAGWGWHLDSMSVEIENAGNRMISATAVAGRMVVSNFAAIKQAVKDPAGAFAMLKEKAITAGKSVIDGLKRMNAESAPPLADLSSSLSGGGGSVGGAAKKAAEEVTEAATVISKDFIKLKADIGTLNKDYSSLALEAGAALQKLEQEHKEKIGSIDKQLKELRKSMTELRKGYLEGEGGFDRDLAGAAVDQETKLAELRADHAEKRKKGLEEISKLEREGKFEEMEARRIALGKELDEVNAKLAKEQSAYDAFMRGNQALADDMQAAREHNSLTEFERFVADLTARRDAAKVDYEERRKDLEQQQADLEEQQRNEERVYAAKRAEYEKTEAVFTRFKDRFLEGLTAMSRGAEGKIIAIQQRFESLRNLIAEVGQFDPDDQGYSFAGAQSAAATRGSTTNNTTNAAVNLNISINGSDDPRTTAQKVEEAVARALQKARLASQ